MSFSGRNNDKISNRPCGGGNKLQTLASTTNKRASSIRAIQNRAGGENRNLIFNINQLGGIGNRHNSQFATNAGGVSGPNIENPKDADDRGADGGQPHPIPTELITEVIIQSAVKQGLTNFTDWFYKTDASGVLGDGAIHPQYSQPGDPNYNLFNKKTLLQLGFYSVIDISNHQFEISGNLVLDTSRDTSKFYHQPDTPDFSYNAYRDNPPLAMAGSITKRFTSILVFNKLFNWHKNNHALNTEIPENFFQWWAGKNVYQAVMNGSKNSDTDGTFIRYQNIFKKYLDHYPLDNLDNAAVSCYDLYDTYKAFENCPYEERIYTQMFSPDILKVYDASTNKQIISAQNIHDCSFDLNDEKVVSAMTVTHPQLSDAAGNFFDQWDPSFISTNIGPPPKEYDQTANKFHNYSPQNKTYYNVNSNTAAYIEPSNNLLKFPLNPSANVSGLVGISEDTKHVRAGTKNIRDWLFASSGGLYSDFEDYEQGMDNNYINNYGISKYFGLGPFYFYLIALLLYKLQFYFLKEGASQYLCVPFCAIYPQGTEMYPYLVSNIDSSPNLIKPQSWDEQNNSLNIFSKTVPDLILPAYDKLPILPTKSDDVPSSLFKLNYNIYRQKLNQKYLKRLTPFELDHMMGNFNNANISPDVTLIDPINQFLLGKLPSGQVGSIGYLRQWLGWTGQFESGATESSYGPNKITTTGGVKFPNIDLVVNTYASTNYTFLGTLLWLLDTSEVSSPSWTKLNIKKLFPLSLQKKHVYFASTAGNPDGWTIPTTASLSGKYSPYEAFAHYKLPLGVKRPPTVDPTFPPDKYVDPSGFDTTSLVMGGNIIIRVQDYAECVFNTLSLQAYSNNCFIEDPEVYESYLGFSMANLNPQLQNILTAPFNHPDWGSPYGLGLQYFYGSGPPYKNSKHIVQPYSDLLGHGGQGWNNNCAMRFYLKEYLFSWQNDYSQAFGDMVVSFAQNGGIGSDDLVQEPGSQTDLTNKLRSCICTALKKAFPDSP